jgi:hypothetical protein
MEPWIAILIGAVGTWIIAIIAIGDRFINHIFKPKLRVVGKGEFSGTLAKHGNGQKARYYLIKVKNLNRIPPAHDAELLLNRVEKSGAAGPDILFDESMPLGWQRQELYPSRTRRIGPEAISALFFVQQDGTLGLTPALGPGGTLASHFPQIHAGRTTLWVTLQATSTEADSPPVRLKIAWDGQWHDGKAEIESSCKVSIDPPP